MTKKKKELVRVEWRNPDHDWPYFTVEKYEKAGWIRLRGADYPDGSATHRGDVILCHSSDFHSIEVIEC